MSCIRSYLDISTIHIPSPNPDWKNIRATKHQWGWIVFIANDLEDIPEWFKQIFDFAISLKCEIINFDCEAEIIERLPQWDWKDDKK